MILSRVHDGMRRISYGGFKLLSNTSNDGLQSTISKVNSGIGILIFHLNPVWSVIHSKPNKDFN